MNKQLAKRIVSLLMVFVMVLGFAVPLEATAAPANGENLNFERVSDVSAGAGDALRAESEQQPLYAPEDIVRVSIVLEEPSTLDAGFSTMDISTNAQAMAYRDDLKRDQATVTARIEKTLGQTLDVKWNLTLAANVVSANVAYGQIPLVEEVRGVQEVILEAQYSPCVLDKEEVANPNMATSERQIGSSLAWAAGYTGAGSRIAIIDTGLDLDHQSFDASAYTFALALEAARKGMTPQAYTESLNLLDAQEIQSLLPQLNAAQRTPTATGETLSYSSKVPYGYNYIDEIDTYIDHDQDDQGGHGSHVSGIAAANQYLPNGDGTFTAALETVKTQGVAPNAQILVMKVFGINGGAYVSDYMAAIEDAIILGCDAVNLSLGSVNPGFSENPTYAALMDRLAQSDTVVTMSAGNDGHWADYALHELPGALYADDVSMTTVGNPGSYTNSLAVASVDNVGSTGSYFKLGENFIVYDESTGFSNLPLTTLAGQQEYVYIDSIGTAEELAALGTEVLGGKILFCSRGETSFFEKANAAVENGAIGTIIYNNDSEMGLMDLTDYSYTAPCILVIKAVGAMARDNGTPVTDEEGNVLYYTGTMTVSEGVETMVTESDYYTMSSFSSWGVPGSLELKPEITAPGGGIYSVDGEAPGGASYTNMSGTSMASPQVAGMAALVSQYIREKGLEEKTGLSSRALAQSLLMSTAKVMEKSEGVYYPVVQQGAGLANVGSAISAGSYVLMDSNATDSWADGKVKAELGHDPERTGTYTFGFTLNNLTDLAQSYMLSADLFTQALLTQGDHTYMTQETAKLQYAITWSVDGQMIEPAEDVSGYDFNGDGLVNTDDVQALLDYAVGVRDQISAAELADLDEDGDVDSHDAYLLLTKLNTGLLLLPANGKTQVSVTITLTEDQKAELNSGYENGAYVEGYIFARQLPTTEGVQGVCHAIPLLGFYGDWSDASMFARGTFVERFFGTVTEPVYSGDTSSNSLILQYPGDDDNLYYSIGNPYGLDETYAPERNAINDETVLAEFWYSPIRNSAATFVVVENQDGEELFFSAVSRQDTSSFYYASAGIWYDTNKAVELGVPVEDLGLKEDDIITVSLVAIPEYFLDDGKASSETLRELWHSGKLGEGTYMQQSFKVDNQAPEMTGVTKDLTTGNLNVTVKDNNYVAAVHVVTRSGEVLASVLPEQTRSGETTSTTIDLSQIQDKLGQYCVILVQDYAANEQAYTIEYGGEPEDYTGRMYAFSDADYRGEMYCWRELDPENLWYRSGYPSTFDGTTDIAVLDITPLAAEYVGGYVYMAADDGFFYISEQDVLNQYTKVGQYSHVTSEIQDLAFNYADNTLYALDDDNCIFTVDLLTLEMTKVLEVTIINPATTSSSYRELTKMAIDGDGNFYVSNYGSSSRCYLYRFTLDQAVDGKIIDLLPVVNDTSADFDYDTSYGNMAWDHSTDTLYMVAASTSSWASSDSRMLIINTETGKTTPPAVDLPEGVSASAAGVLYDVHTAFYIVPPKTPTILDRPSTEAISVTLDRSSLTCLENTSFTLETVVAPWNLQDKSLIWTSSDESVAIVDGEGKVTALKAGTAQITATTVAEPHCVGTCELTVKTLPDLQLSAQVTDTDGNAYWAEFNVNAPEEWKAVSAAHPKYMSATLMGDTIFVDDGIDTYGIDPDTYAVIDQYMSHGILLAMEDLTATPKDENGYFGFLTFISSGGLLFTHVDPYEVVIGDYLDLGTFIGRPMIAVAHKGFGTGYGSALFDPNLYPAAITYIMTDTGHLLEVKTVTDDGGESYSIGVPKVVGATGLDLTRYKACSMHYDEASGYIFLVAQTTGQQNHLYAIDPETLLYTDLGDFGEGVMPVVGLYQYTRVSDLTVRVRPDAVATYDEEQVQLTAQVLPTTYPNEVVWSSSDPSIATVDQNGLVTTLGDGEVIITATSVATDENGNTASGSSVFQVTKRAHIDAQLDMQLVMGEEEEVNWVQVNTQTREYDVLAPATVKLTGAGAHDGKIYGSTGTFGSFQLIRFYQVDPANGYAYANGTSTWGTSGFHDGTTAPAKTLTFTNEAGEEVQVPAFGAPVYLLHSRYVGMLWDYQEGSSTDWRLPMTDMAAIAYAGESTYTDEDGVTHDTLVYYILGADSTIYQFHMWANYVEGAQTASDLDYEMAYLTVGNLGVEFEDYTAMTMTYVRNETCDGLVIGDAGTGMTHLYYVDMTAEALILRIVTSIPEATAIDALYSDIDMKGTDHKIAGVTAAETQMAQAVTQEEIQAELDAERQQEQEQPQFQLSGVLNSTVISPTAEGKPENNCEGGKTTLTLTADETSTNGIITVEYDADKLTLESVDSRVAFKSIVEEEGKLTIGYVSATAITDIAVLTFTVKEDATVTVTTREENASAPNASRNVTLTVPAHDYKVTETKAPACTEDGYEVYTCNACGESYTETLKATGHDYKQEVVDPTCTEAGYTEHTCTVCGHSYMTDVKNPVDHAYKAVVTEPTCTDAGYTTYTCDLCGHSYTSDYTEVTSHNFGQWETVKEATCTEKGQEKRTCEGCGITETRDTDMVAHDMEEVVTAPTCTEVGYTTHTCTVCGYSYITDLVQATGHDYEAVVTAPTCTEEGYTTYICACGESYVDDYVDALGHTFGAWTESKAPACDMPGEETRTCEVCGESETRETVTFCPAEDFTDVDTKQWYHEGVCYVLRNGLMEGKGEGIFAPNANLTRAELVTVLYRMAGTPSVEGLEHPFADVAEGTWYTDAVIWAYNAEVVKGISDTAFAPGANITREQIATILYRYAGADAVAEDALADFTDADQVNDWAVEAMNWAVAVGLINGMDETTLAPQGNATRAQIATILMRYCQG